MEMIFGRRPVREALAGPRRVIKIHLAGGVRQKGSAEDILKAARTMNVPVSAVTREDLDERTGHATHQGVVADVSDYTYAELHDLIQAVDGREHGLVVALDQVTDPQNLGAVIRTSVAAGADAVLLGKRRSAPITAAVVKASAGLTERAMVVRANLGTALTRLKESGFWVVGADGGGSDEIWSLDLSGKIVVVLGSEGRGLSRLVRERCDWLSGLPLAPGVDSLNVSAAAAAIIYEVVRQRRCRT